MARVRRAPTASEGSALAGPHTPSREADVTDKNAGPLRVALFGSGHQAALLAGAMAEGKDLVVVGVASPNILEREPGAFAGLVLDPDPAALLDRARPDAVVIAARVQVRRDLAILATQSGLPALIEKPIGFTLEEHAELAGLSARHILMPAHPMAHAPGVRRLCELVPPLGGAQSVRCVRHVQAGSLDAPEDWSHYIDLFEALYHVVYLAGAPLGRCAARVVEVQRLTARGKSPARSPHAPPGRVGPGQPGEVQARRPDALRAVLDFGGVPAEIGMDFSASFSGVDLVVQTATTRLVWQRRDRREALLATDGAGHVTPVAYERCSDFAGLFAAFAAAARAGAPDPELAQAAHDTFRVTADLMKFIPEARHY